MGVTWIDAQDNLWLFSGFQGGPYTQFDDVWMFNTKNLQWLWISGHSNISNQQPNWGTQGKIPFLQIARNKSRFLVERMLMIEIHFLQGVTSSNSTPGARYAGNGWSVNTSPSTTIFFYFGGYGSGAYPDCTPTIFLITHSVQ